MADPVVSITNGVPTAGTGTITTLGQTLLDGANITQGAIADAAVTAGATGSVSAKLRSLSRDIGSLVTAWGSTLLDFGSGTGGTRTQRVIIDSSQFSPVSQTTKSASAPVTIASDQGYAGNVGGITTVPSTTLTRPATAPTYASGQLFANSVTAGSVTNLTWATAARISGGSGVVIGAQIQKSGNTTTGAAFRLHLFTVAPTYVTAGDTSAISTVVVGSAKGYLGYIDITTMVAFSDVSVGSGAPDNSRGGLPFVAAVQSLFGFVEARGNYAGVSGEVLTVFLDILQD